MIFSLGDKVQWTSQSGGYRTTKRGRVVAIVVSGEDPHDRLPSGMRPVGTQGFGICRYGTSYLVQVGKSSRVYWPHVCHLRLDDGKGQP